VWLLVATVAALRMLSLSPVLGRVQGAILLVALALYIWRALSRDTAAEPGAGDRGHAGLADRGTDPRGPRGADGGAWLLVTGATGIARALGVSETVIGLTVVAVGTSLPELATSVVGRAAGRGGAGARQYPRLQRVQHASRSSG
jgi:cation:H+ antiporter